MILLFWFVFLLFSSLFTMSWGDLWFLSFWRFERRFWRLFDLFLSFFIVLFTFSRWDILTCAKFFNLVRITDAIFIKLFSTFLEMFKFLFVFCMSFLLSLNFFVFNELLFGESVNVELFDHSNHWNYKLICLLWEMSFNIKVGKKKSSKINHGFYIIDTNFWIPFLEKPAGCENFDELDD